MNTFFTADTHFDHDNIRRHCNRPFATIDEMNDTLIRNWNNIVSKKDQVYILGDFAFRNHNRFIMALNGKKTLVLGNHDKQSGECLRNFTEVTQIKVVQFDNINIVMCHYAMRVWPHSHYGSWLLYGHSHGRLPETRLECDVGVDVWDYTPVPFEVLKLKMKAKDIPERVLRTDEELAQHVEKLRLENCKYRQAGFNREIQ